MYAIYMVTFTINIPQMLAYIPYMDPMGNGTYVWLHWGHWCLEVWIVLGLVRWVHQASEKSIENVAQKHWHSDIKTGLHDVTWAQNPQRFYILGKMWGPWSQEVHFKKKHEKAINQKNRPGLTQLRQLFDG